jgi:pimeloyl-ACP methyl ester carboxylesterase
VSEALPTSDREPQFLDLPHGPLAFVDEGPRDAPALVAIHGVPGSVRDFRYLAPQLSSDRRVVRVDLPGFGGSAPSREAVSTLAARADVVMALADHLELLRFGVLGHSMGGATALLLAAREPRRISALVLVASIGLRPHRGLGMSPRRFGLLSRGFAIPGVSRVLTRAARERYRARRFPGADSMGPEAFAIHFRAIAAADFGAIRAAATGPLPATLLAWARDDAMVESAIGEELSRAMPRARTLVYEEGGHNIQKTQAVGLAAAIREMLPA